MKNEVFIPRLEGSPDKKLLDPWECCFFTWMDVTRNRELEWKSGNITECDGLYMNNYNSYKVSDSPSGNYYWVNNWQFSNIKTILNISNK